MPTNRTRRVRTRAGGNALTLDNEFYLQCGVMLDGSQSTLDRDEALARKVYEMHRDRLLQGSVYSRQAGWRPWAYWQYELGEKQPIQRWKERRVLRDRGLLRPEEIATLNKMEEAARSQGLCGPYEDPSEVQT